MMMDCTRYFNLIVRRISVSEEYFEDNDSIWKRNVKPPFHRLVTDKETMPLIEKYRKECNLENSLELINPGITVVYEYENFYYYYNKHYIRPGVF